MNDIIPIITTVTRNAFESAAWNVAVKFAVIYCVASVVISGANYLLATYTEIGRDDSDPPTGRSGMKIMTDHLTGCQYFQAPNGGLTPRLSATGGHICSTKGNA